MSEYLDQGRKKNHLAVIIAVLVIGVGVIMFMRRGVPEPVNGEVVNVSAPVEALNPEAAVTDMAQGDQVKRGGIARKTALKDLKVKTAAAVVAAGKGISTGLGLKKAELNSQQESVPLPPQEVIDLAAKPASKGGLRCPAPGCPCGKGCVYTDITTPVISRNQDGSWNLKCSGVTDYDGKITPLTSIFKWDRGSMVMVSEFQAIE